MLQRLAAALYWAATATVFVCVVYVIFLPNESLNEIQFKSFTYNGAIIGVTWLICFALHWAIVGRLPWPAHFLNKSDNGS